MSAISPSVEIEIIRPSRLVELRNALLCALAVIFAVALTNPIAEAPFNDDWSYNFTVRQLIKPGELKLNRWSQSSASEVQLKDTLPTFGKLTYNGWASASLIAQAYWGLLLVKLFGYSYTTLRFSTIALAAAAIFICYLLGRRAGLIPRFSIFASLLVGLCPLYLPVANSFMTDAPGLFFILLSMYAIARSMDSNSDSRSIAWLGFGVVVGLIGGTGRQIVWLVPLVMAPYAAWVRRKNLPFVISAVVGWIIVLVCAFLTVHWFNRQLYAIPETSLAYELKSAMKKPSHYLLTVLSLPLTAIWVLLPAFWGVLARRWNCWRIVLVLVILLGPIVELIVQRPHYAMVPWIGNTLAKQGVMGGSELAGNRPIVMPVWLRIRIAAIVLGMASVLLADGFIWLVRPSAWRKAFRFFLFHENVSPLLPAMALFAIGYLVLLLPRCASNMVYDRYVIPLMPCVLFPLLVLYQRWGALRVPKFAWFLLGFYALFAIATTQEVTALTRARGRAFDKLITQGVSRTEIDAGFELDNETQLFTQGHINDPRIVNPPDTFKKMLGPTYSVQAKYRLEFAPAPDSVTTENGWVDYTTYLYPFHRRVWIDKFSDPWWLDPERAKTHPPDSWHRIILPDAVDDQESEVDSAIQFNHRGTQSFAERGSQRRNKVRQGFDQLIR